MSLVRCSVDEVFPRLIEASKSMPIVEMIDGTSQVDISRSRGIATVNRRMRAYTLLHRNPCPTAGREKAETFALPSNIGSGPNDQVSVRHAHTHMPLFYSVSFPQKPLHSLPILPRLPNANATHPPIRHTPPSGVTGPLSRYVNTGRVFVWESCVAGGRECNSLVI